MTDNDIKPGTHLWVLYDGQPVVVIKDIRGDYYAAGAWEGPFGFDQLTVISAIEAPAKLRALEPYYLRY